MRATKLFRRVVLALALLIGISSFLIQGGHTRATDLPVVYKYGTLINSETWNASNVYFLTGQLTVPDGVTLTIPAGTVVKVNYHSGGIKADQGGQVVVNGQTSNEVVFTSYKDDSFGGDTNGDGNSSSPNNSDYGNALSSEGGSLNVQNAIFRYASTGVNASCTYGNGPVQVSDSLFNSPAVLNNCGMGVVTLQRNSFDTYTSNNSEAIYMYRSVPTGISLSGVNKNTFSAHNNTFRLYGDSHTVPSNGNWTISGESGVVMRLSDVGIEGQLVVNNGAIIKTGYHEQGLHVEPGGVLDVQGAEGSPVIFTSSRDDSVGGDTDRDGPSVPSSSDYHALEAKNGGASISMSYALVKYSSRAVVVDCLYTSSSVDLTDNTFKGNVGFYKCNEDDISLQRNQFDLLSTGTGWSALSLFNTQISGITLVGANKNIFAGQGVERVIDISTSSEYTPLVTAGRTLTLDSSGGAVFRLSYPKVNGTLNLNAGIIIKVGNGFKLGADSVLNVNGTESSPVTITSYKDDSIGGDSNGDGATMPSNNDIGVILSMPENATVNSAYLRGKYAGQFISMQNGTANFADTQVSYVGTGLNVTGGHVIYRGTFENVSEKYIRACNWTGSCSVDAAYIDWGNANGPFVTGADKVCGSVSVSPWKYNGSTSHATTFQVKNCDNSPTPQDKAITSANNFHQAIANKRIDCDNGYQAACDAIESYLSCFGAAIQLAASASTIPVTFDNPTETIDTVGSTAATASDIALRAVEVENPQTFNIHVGTKILGIIGLFNSMHDAYESCH